MEKCGLFEQEAVLIFIIMGLTLCVLLRGQKRRKGELGAKGSLPSAGMVNLGGKGGGE